MSDLLSKTPASRDDIVAGLRPFLGKRGGRYVYVRPTEKNDTDMRNLVRFLTAYEAKPTPENLEKLDNLLEELKFTTKRFTADPDVLYFCPKDTKKAQIVFGYRMGAMKVPGDLSTYKNPLTPFIVSSEHEGTDGATFAAMTQFMDTKAKFIIFNALHQDASKEKSKCQPSNKKSNASHSSETNFVPVLQELVKTYPFLVLTNAHGMRGSKSGGGQRQTRLLLVNSYNSEFLRNNVSFPALLSIALAQRDFPARSITIASELPGSIIDSQGKKRPLTTKKNVGDPIFISMTGAHNTNIPGHIMNRAVCGRGTQRDYSVHSEFGPEYRKKDAPIMDMYTHAVMQALDWYVRYDNDVHNIWHLPPDITANMRLYPAYFEKVLLEAAPKSFNARAADMDPPAEHFDLADTGALIDIEDNLEEIEDAAEESAEDILASSPILKFSIDKDDAQPVVALDVRPRMRA